MPCLFGALAFGTLLFVAVPARADLREEIKQLVPAASAMRQADFEVLAHSTAQPTQDLVKDKSLTWMLLCLNPTDASEEQQKEFRYLGSEPPKPSVVAEEIYRVGLRLGNRRVLSAPVTFLQADRITEVTAEQSGDTVTGSVAFKVPDLYEGRVQYLATKQDDKWRITEWKLPAYGIHLVRDTDGQWTKK